MGCQQVHAHRERQDLPTSRASAGVQEDQHKCGPQRAKQCDQAGDQSQHHARRNDVSQGFCPQKSRESIALHGLENVVFCGVEDFWVVSALFLNAVCDVVEDALRKDDFALGAGQKVCVEDFLGRSANVGTSYSVVGRLVAVHLRRRCVG